MSSTRSIRFGATDGTRYSEYWKVAGMARRPELVIAGNRTGHFMHVTMHKDERYGTSRWHYRKGQSNAPGTLPRRFSQASGACFNC